MKLTYKILLGLLCGVFICNVSRGHSASLAQSPDITSDTLLFRFAPGECIFWADYMGNKESIQTMTQLLRANKPSIEAGDTKVRVLGFCSSYGSVQENLAAAKNRSNQVKSYFIIHEGLKEEHFRTTNSTHQWHGITDVIAVAFLFENRVQESLPPMESQKGAGQIQAQSSCSQERTYNISQPTNTPEPTNQILRENQSNTLLEKEKHFSQWAIKTNVAYWAATVANLGIEYSFGKHYSIDLPIIYSPYTISRNYQLRILAAQPEFRYWLRDPMQGHFWGVHFNIGVFNIAVDSKNRYQSPDGFYGIGLSYGYMLPFSRHWAAEFTIGAGYVHTEYDSYYNISNGARYKQDVPYDYWGLTKIGIGLLYRFGK